MLEHPPQLNITQSELAPPVSDYFSNLLAQRDAILARYGLTPETAEKFCDIHTSDEDRENILALYEKMVYVIEHKEMPPSELLEQERIKEQQRINDFFGTEAEIEVPPLPPTITPERIEYWKQKRFELRYLPPLTLEKDDKYSGWKKKPIVGVNLFDNLDKIQYLPENQQNPHLDNLAPNQLAGCWMLIDTRPKPNFQNKGTQSYEDDQDIQTIIKQMVKRGIVNKEAKDGRRNCIHPSKFDNPEFWQFFYDYLGISPHEAVIRLPRVIEQSMFGHEKEWNDTKTYEWAEEYYENRLRLAGGCGIEFNGVSNNVSWCSGEDKYYGFRCVVVFSSL